MMKIKKAKWLVILMIIALLFGMIPASVGAEYENNEDDYEQLFLSNGGDPGNNGLYRVELLETHGELTLLYSFDDVVNFDFVTHIGGSADGSELFVIGEDSGHLGVYSIAENSFVDKGEIANYPSAVTQVAVSPENELFMVCKDRDELFKVDVDNVEATFVSKIDIDVQGADIAFGADGTLYLYSAGNLENLYTVDIETGITNLVGSTGAKITGLAIRDGGLGDLVGSDARTNEFIIIDKDNGQIVGDPIPMKIGNVDFVHTWGDMATGYLIPEDPPTYEICGFKQVDGVPTGGWTIKLEVMVNGEFQPYMVNGEPVTETTNSDGKYCFTDLPAGTYRVSEVQQDGYTQVYPADNAHIVVLPSGIVYGVESAGNVNLPTGSGDLYEIDVINQTETKLFDGAENYLYPYPNGLAFDDINDRLYFATNAVDLYFWEFGADDIVFAGQLVHDDANVCGAAFGGGYYWYIPDNSNQLYKVSFNANGTIADQVAVATIGGSFAYGDIVIDYEEGMLYGSGIQSYFTYDIGKDVYFEAPGTDGSFLQIAWGSDGVLYGHHGQRIQVGSNHRDWVSIEPATGETSYLFTGENLYVDLASGMKYYNFRNERDPDPVCETAWAYGENIATQNNEVVDNPSEAWGWTNEVGEESEGVDLELWAAAGQNDFEKGHLVGTVKVEVDNGAWTVTYQISDNLDCWISEAHLWVGDEELPRIGRWQRSSSAPGSFNYKAPEISNDGKTATFKNVEPGDWLAAHAVVCCYDLFEADRE